MSKNPKHALLALSSIPIIMTLGNSMLIPVLPVIRRELHITSLQASLIITIFSIMAILFIPIAGYLSDRIGRKKVIVPSLIIAGIGGAISAAAAIWMAKPYMVIMIGRVLQGIGAAGAAPIVMPTVGDLFKSEEKVSAGLGLIETANTFGKVLSPIVGSLLAAIAWFYPFAAIPLFCLISVLLVMVFVHSPKEENEPLPLNQFLRSIKLIFRREGRWLYVVFALGGIGMFMLFAFLVYLSDVLEDVFHIKGVIKGAVLAIPLAVLCTASYVTGKAIGENKERMKVLSMAGFLLSSAAIAACVYLNSVTAQITLLSIAGLGIGVALPCMDALITEGIEKEKRGTITSFYMALRFVGVAFGPPAASLLAHDSPDPMFWVLTGFGLMSAVLAWLFIRPDIHDNGGSGGGKQAKLIHHRSKEKPKMVT